ncbi:MAG: hypothetical protein BGO25_03495 [Acidobacteriales bacterium 59-55]|nr:MAG: hypothetical protein BGO25_03495 [Acidobacteriales bacterium 59-55]
MVNMIVWVWPENVNLQNDLDAYRDMYLAAKESKKYKLFPFSFCSGLLVSYRYVLISSGLAWQ